MSTTLAAAPIAVEQEPCIVLDAIPWHQYEDVLKAFPEQGGLQITYIDGRLTLLSPRRRHDRYEQALAGLIQAVASGLGMIWEPAGHTTARREDVKGGVKGDATFYLGENAETMLGPVEVNLSTQLPPDLAIGVELSHKADDSVSVWGRLGVPEVWRYDVDRETVVFGTRQPDASYAPSPRIEALPELEPADVHSQLQLAKELGSSRWYAQLGDRVRDVLLPRRGR